MSAGTNGISRVFALAGVTLPAAALTWLGSTLSKDPSDFVLNWGGLLPCSVILFATLLGLVVDSAVRSSDTTPDRVVSGAAVVSSLAASFLGFLVVVVIFVD